MNKESQETKKAIEGVVEATNNLAIEVEKASEVTADATKVMAESVEVLTKTLNESKEDYDAVKKFYIEKFNLDPELVDLNSNYSILLMCASGAGNSSIAKFLNIPEGSVELVLNEVFGFVGWKEDLEINPYKIYKQAPQNVPNSMKEMCVTMERIEKRLEDEWV